MTEYPRIMCDRMHGNYACKNDAVPGDSRCGFHGGKVDGKRAKARSRAALAHVGGYVERKFGDPRWIDPGYALLEEVARSAGHVAFLEKRVNDLEESELVWNHVMRAVETKNGGGESGDYELLREEHKAEISQWWELYERERKHLATVSAAALKAGVEERRLRLAERAADALGDMLGQLLGDFGLDQNDPRVREIVSNRLGQLLASDWMGGTDADEVVSTARDAAHALPPGTTEVAPVQF